LDRGDRTPGARLVFDDYGLPKYFLKTRGYCARRDIYVAARDEWNYEPNWL